VQKTKPTALNPIQ